MVVFVLPEIVYFDGDGFEKRARDIRVGEFVKTSDGGSVEVMCTITQRMNDVNDICEISEGLYITLEHPIRNIYVNGLFRIWFMMLKCILRWLIILC